MEVKELAPTPADIAIELVVNAVADCGGMLTVTSEGDPLRVTFRNPEHHEQTLVLVTRAASPALERVLELLALALWRRQSGAWSLETGVVIRLPRLPARLDRWHESIDLMLSRSNVKDAASTTLPFALCSERGGYLLRLPGLTVTQPDPDDGSHTTVTRTDIPQHEAALRALKILLAQMGDHHQAWWGGVKEPITTGLQLARLAETSQSGVYGLLDALAQRGWIRKGYGRELRLLDVPAVLAWWLDHAKHQLRRLIPVRPLYVSDPLGSWSERCRWLKDQDEKLAVTPWAISGWAACQLLDLSILHHPEAKPFTVTIGRSAVALPAVLHAWKLVECEPRDAVFWIEPTPPQRAALAATLLVDGVRVVDGWQAALDVASDPDRGIEQAMSIAERLWPAS